MFIEYATQIFIAFHHLNPFSTLSIYSYYPFNLLEDNNIIDAQPYLLTGSITESPCVHVCRDGMIM